MSTEKMRMRTGMLLFAVLALSVGTAAGQQRSNSARASQPQVRVKPTPTRTPAPRIKSGEVSAKPQVDAKPPQVSVKPTAAPGPRRANPAGQAALPPRVSVKPTATPAPRRTETERPVKPPTGAGAAAAADPALKDAVSAAKLKYSQDLVRRSQQAQATGDLKGARSVYDEARQAARDENAPHLEAQAALRYAQTLEAQGPAPSKPTIHMKGDGPPPGSSAPDSSATFREAREAYAQVIQIGTPQQRVQAQNNTAVLALREGKPQEAVAVLKDVDVNALEPEQRYLYNYNYGRALELAGNTSEAYGRYARVLEAEPGYDPAIQGAFRVLTASRPPRFLEAAKLAQALLARGERQ
ncbi:MAG TPA: hypothetical protein VKH43_11185, partial [Thermoanaerobaculia bacterium]|nr:hypothetical protein [Thermoanaerobaculia bacterium]